MGTYHLTTADGATYEVQAPDEHAALAAIQHPSVTGKPAAPKMDAAGDIGGGIVGGAARGLVGLATAPATVPHMLAHGAALGAEWLARKAMGLPEPTQEQADAKNRAEAEGQLVPSPGVVAAAINQAADDIAYHPTTTAGKFASSIAEFAPSAITGPGGAVRKLIETTVPAVASEAAGQATHVPDNATPEQKAASWEPYARIAAGIVAGAPVSGIAAMYHSAPARMVADATRGVTPAQFQAAQDLQTYAAKLPKPVNLTGPEALQFVTEGGTNLGGAMRVVEGSTGGGAKTAQFFAKRPGQVSAALGQALDKIAPASKNPSSIGVRAADAAQAALDKARQDINDSTRPLYDHVAPHEIPPQDFVPIAKSAAFRASLDRLRNDPVVGPEHVNLPDNSIGVIDAVTKDMNTHGEALSNAMNPGFNPQAAAIYRSDAQKARDIARNPGLGGNAAYDEALLAQEQARKNILNPMERGPVGAMAKYQGTQVTNNTNSAIDAIFPQKRTNEGGHHEIADALQRIGERDALIGNDLTRQHLANAYDIASTDLQGSANQYAGANFRKAVAGSPQKRLNLEAALNAIPGGKAAEIPQLLDVFRATGMRMRPGSNTSHDTQLKADLGEAPLPAQAARAAVTGGLSLPGLVMGMHDASKRAWLGKRTGGLADLFLAPDSVSQIAALAQRDPQSPLVQMFARAMLQAPLETRPQ